MAYHRDMPPMLLCACTWLSDTRGGRFTQPGLTLSSLGRDTGHTQMHHCSFLRLQRILCACASKGNATALRFAQQWISSHLHTVAPPHNSAEICMVVSQNMLCRLPVIKVQFSKRSKGCTLVQTLSMNSQMDTSHYNVAVVYTPGQFVARNNFCFF